MIALGSEYKYGVGFPPIDGIHLEDCNFEVKTYVSHNKSVTFEKSDEVHVCCIVALTTAQIIN